MPGTSADLQINISANGQQQAAAAVETVAESLEQVAPAANAASEALTEVLDQVAGIAPATNRATAGISSLSRGLGPLANNMTSIAGATLSLGNNLGTVPPVISTITRDLSSLNRGLGPTVSNFNRVNTAGGALNRTVSLLGAGFITLPPRINAAGTAAGNLVPPLTRANTAVQATTRNYTGLSRIIQDLPFGFIGIQNNLTQLLPAAGAAGLVLSAVVSAVTFAQTGFSNWTRGLKDNSEQLKKTKDDQEAFNESLKTAEQGALATAFQLKSFVAIARDNTKSLDERNYALKEANKLLGDHGEKLTLVNINTKAVTDEVNKFTQALISQAVAAKYTDKVAEGFIKQANAAKEFAKAEEAFNDPKTQRARFTNDGTFKQARKNLIETNQAYRDATKQFQTDNADLQKAIDDSNKLFAQLGTFDKTDPKPKVEKAVKAIREAVRKSLDVAPLISVTDAVAIINAKIAFNKAEAKRDIDGFIKFINDETPPDSLGKLGFTFEIGKQLQKIDADAKAVKERLKRNDEELRALVSSFAQNAASSVGESIGNAVSGQGNPFAPLVSLLSDGLKALGKLYIKIGVEMLLAQKAIKAIASNPYLTIAAGIALTALGQIAQNALKGGTKLAEGGVVTGPTRALIGEAGQSEAVIPLSRLSSMFGGDGNRVEVFGLIKGRDIVLSSKRESGSRGRTY